MAQWWSFLGFHCMVLIERGTQEESSWPIATPESREIIMVVCIMCQHSPYELLILIVPCPFAGSYRMHTISRSSSSPRLLGNKSSFHLHRQLVIEDTHRPSCARGQQYVYMKVRLTKST